VAYKEEYQSFVDEIKIDDILQDHKQLLEVEVIIQDLPLLDKSKRQNFKQSFE
jgi:hypothetical protein